MRAVVDQAVERGEPIAGLTASEATIYRRFGFGVATRFQTAVGRHPPPAPRRGAQSGASTTGAGGRAGASCASPPPTEATSAPAGPVGPVVAAVTGRARPQPRLLGGARPRPRGGPRRRHRPLRGGPRRRRRRARRRRHVPAAMELVLRRRTTSWPIERRGRHVRRRRGPRCCATSSHVDLVTRVEWHAAPVDHPLRWWLADPRALMRDAGAATTSGCVRWTSPDACRPAATRRPTRWSSR